MRKKKILFHSDRAIQKTGFGRNTKAILTYLYNTGKYDIVNFGCHVHELDNDNQRTPWKTIGAIPADQNLVNNYLAPYANNPEQREAHIRKMMYGGLTLNKVVEEFKPDVYIGVQDIWGVDFALDNYWFPQINSVIWTTLDSLPLLPSAVQCASKVKNYWVWSDFATKEFKRMGINHVETMHGALECDKFYPLTREIKAVLRKKHGIEEDRFMIGFVFRNQLRKSVHKLIEGYKILKNSKPDIKAGLLLHTSFNEGWNIPKLAAESGVDIKEIYTTYICEKCGDYQVKPYCGHGLKCGVCGHENSVKTTGPQLGVSEDQLNQVYNLMDVYCHPFTSGGQEIPIQEAKLAGLVTLVTSYSCGEEMCYKEANSISLDWVGDREFGSEFVKAVTNPMSIAKNLMHVYQMPRYYRDEMGSKARKWVIDNFSVQVVGKKIEDFLDKMEVIDWGAVKPIVPDPNAFVPAIPDEKNWLKCLYKNILKMEVQDNDSGLIHWMNQIKTSPRQSIENFFRQEASRIVGEKSVKPVDFSELLGKDDEHRRILYVMPEGFGDVFMSTSLFKSIKEQYPDYNLYVATKKEFMPILNGNEYIYKILEYQPVMDNLLMMEGVANHKGYFDIAFVPHVTTQRFLTYLHNGKTKIAYNDLKY